MSTHAFLKIIMAASDQDLEVMVHRHPEIARDLQINPMDVHATGTMCPVTNTEVVTPCTLSACSLYTDLSGCHNCVLVYKNSQVGELSTLDLSLLYRKPESEVKEIVASAMTKVQRGMKDGGDADFVFTPLAGVCSCCESPIEEDPVSAEDYDYCSQACVSLLPPAKARSGYLPASGFR